VLTFLEVGFGGNLVQGFRAYAWRAVPSFPQIALWGPSLAFWPQPFNSSGSNYSNSVDVLDERNSIAFWRRQILAVIVHEWLLCLGSPADRLGRSEGTFREERNPSCGFCFAETSCYEASHSRFIHYPSSSWNIQSSTYCTAKIFLWPSWKRFIFLQIQWSLISSIWVWKCDGNGALTQFFKLCHKSKINFA